MNKPKESSDEQMRRQRIAVDRKVTSTLQRIAEQNGSTINTVAEVICGIMLQVCTRNQDVVFGKVVSGRNADIKGIEDMVGLFINTIPVRVRTEDKMSIRELLKKQQEQGNESTSYDYYSLAEIQNETLQGTELIKVLYVFENHMSGLESEQQEKDNDQMTIAFEQAREQTNYAISIAGYEMDGALGFDIMYNPNQFSEEDIQRLLERLVKISEEIAENPDRQVAEIETVTEDEKEKILHDFNATKTEYPREKTVVELFEEQAAKTPDQIALVFEGEEVSYRELNERANVLAHKLRELGVKPDDFVAIMAERSIEMITGIYGIIKAGAAYVPIDPTYPEERIAFMLEDCQPKAMLLYEAEYETDLTKFDLKEAGIWEGNIQNPEKVNKAEDLIYCIYTSGTTGTPKGTLLEHHGVVNLKYRFERNLEITPADNIIQFANYVFDASVSEMTMALLNGATLVCMPAVVGQNPKEFSEYCKQNRVTVATLPPNYYLQKEVDVEFRKLLTAGSESSMALIKKVGDSSYINDYGPTENTVCASYWEKEENWDATFIPIGKPISNTQIYILNGDNLCGIGVPGELCITGDGLA
ncbi:non-ribosomal peptide synthetase, partial [Lysinibacillus sphaericus]|uniref:non-ribosomal peptide synthetase n=1 Tax=Lysinibacillus sphaericus TaxID=1421 RepID=UPI0018CDF366